MTTALLTAIDHYDEYGRHHDGHWFPFFLFPLLLLVGFLVARRRRWAMVGGHGSHGVHGARNVLAERYARGEIDANEYRQRSEVLNERPAKKK